VAAVAAVAAGAGVGLPTRAKIAGAAVVAVLNQLTSLIIFFIVSATVIE
jgi:hypothetical protein